MAHSRQRVVIVGGGFAGIRSALNLDRQKLPELEVLLISDKPHFEYHAALYRVVTGRSPLEVCIPLREIFGQTDVQLEEDFINLVSLKDKYVKGSSGFTYQYDYLILALGSETVYFDIPGLRKLAHGFKSMNEALRLKKRLHQLVSESKTAPLHCVVVGGGASGTELAAELISYLSRLAHQHQIDPSMITVELIEAAPRLLPSLPSAVSERVYQQLHSLGVNIYLNRRVVREEVEKVLLQDMHIKTKLVIWTAGVQPNRLYQSIKGLKFDKEGRVMVDHYLQAHGYPNVFVIGDAAASQFGGMAQTALHQGRFVAEVIPKKIARQMLPIFRPVAPWYVIPVGPGWAAAVIGSLHFYGWFSWFLRRLVDFRFFLSILPLSKAWLVFQNEKILSECCPICSEVSQPEF